MTDEPGPGFFHIPIQRAGDRGWLDQLTAEQCIFEKKAGRTIRKWILPRGRANEVWDTTCYAYAALCGLKADPPKIVMESMATLIAKAVGE